MTELLRIEGLSLARAGRPVLDGVSFAVSGGEMCALMGLSGSGKTTILRACVALEPFDAGKIAVRDFELGPGRVPGEPALKPLRKLAGMVFQAHALFEHLTAGENVALAPVYGHGVSPEAARARAGTLLESLGVGARAGALPRELSGGEAQRVAIARALAVDPPLLLMDEPTAALDPARRGSLAQTLRGLAGEGRALLFTTHDPEFARSADRVIVLAAGRVAEEGTPEDVLTNPKHPATQELLRTPAPKRGR